MPQKALLFHGFALTQCVPGRRTQDANVGGRTHTMAPTMHGIQPRRPRGAPEGWLVFGLFPEGVPSWELSRLGCRYASELIRTRRGIRLECKAGGGCDSSYYKLAEDYYWRGWASPIQRPRLRREQLDITFSTARLGPQHEPDRLRERATERRRRCHRSDTLARLPDYCSRTPEIRG